MYPFFDRTQSHFIVFRDREALALFREARLLFRWKSRRVPTYYSPLRHRPLRWQAKSSRSVTSLSFRSFLFDKSLFPSSLSLSFTSSPTTCRDSQGSPRLTSPYLLTRHRSVSDDALYTHIHAFWRLRERVKKSTRVHIH